MPIFVCAALWLGGLGLAPGGERPVPEATAPAPIAPRPPSSGVPGAVALGGALLAAAALARKQPGEALGLEPPEDAVVVFVPGHGQGEGSEAFADLVDLMGLDPSDARFFDYRWVTGERDPVRASEHAGITETVIALNSYLGAVAGEGRPVWVVGFSKGGATVADLIAAWDDGSYRPPGRIQEAFLLDPPISAGAHGWLQSLGRLVGPVPDDGGYDPVQCRFLVWGCDDERRHLGEASGVEVLVIRNPKAGITSFGDAPDGLRVVDAPDPGPGFWEELWHHPFSLPGRIAAAHDGVLADPEVARCVVSEMWEPGSCDLERSFPTDSAAWPPFRPRWHAPYRVPSDVRPF